MYKLQKKYKICHINLGLPNMSKSEIIWQQKTIFIEFEDLFTCIKYTCTCIIYIGIHRYYYQVR